MKLAAYFFRQFIPPYIFGLILFIFVMVFDKLFDLIDLIFNKGVSGHTVIQMFFLFIPTTLPLTVPMAFILAALVSFGRLSEENELTAVRAAGVSLVHVLWPPILFAILVSIAMVPFNARFAPWCSQTFVNTYENIIRAEPLLNVEPKKFFSIKNIRILAETINSKTNLLENIHVYQLTGGGNPADRIFAKEGKLESDDDTLSITLWNGQLQRYQTPDTSQLKNTLFEEYQISVSVKNQDEFKSTRFRTISTKNLKKMIADLASKGFPTAVIKAELALRIAIAFAPISLVIMGIPLATRLKKGGKSFGFGISIVVIFLYYLVLVFGLQIAEKEKMPPHIALWLANVLCLFIGIYLTERMVKNI